MKNIESYISRLNNRLTEIKVLVDGTTIDVLDDSSGVLDELYSKIYSVSSRLESSIATLEGQSTILDNNYHEKNLWGVAEDEGGYDG